MLLSFKYIVIRHNDMTIRLAVKIPLKLCSLWSITNSLFKPHNDMLALRQIPCNIKVN